MPIAVSYMGTKRQLAKLVAAQTDDLRDGPFLDLFAGVCAISREIGTARPIWCNDLQLFSHTVASAFFCSSGVPAFDVAIGGSLGIQFELNRDQLLARLGSHVDREQLALSDGRVAAIRELEAGLPYFEATATLKKERARLSLAPNTRPYRLFSMTYAGTYLGL